MKKIIFLFFLLAMQSAVAEKILFQSSDQKVNLLELYSTQSCSSCPPAQDWVNQFKNHSGLYKTFIPVVFHVDYWDYIGWKDTFSNSAYTKKQRDYAREWKSSRVYTPMFVLNGNEWRNRSSKELQKKNKSEGRATVSLTQKKGYKVQFSFNEEVTSGYIHATLLGNSIKTKIRAGENDGLDYSQEFIVLEYKTKNVEVQNKKVSQYFTFSGQPKHSNKSLVFWFTKEKSSTPIVVVAGKLKL